MTWFGAEESVSIAKAMAAAAAGRSLLLLNLRKREPITWRTVALVICYEIPLIAAFALLGWHAAGFLGLSTEDARVVVTVLLAMYGKTAVDVLLTRVLPRG